MKLELKLKYAIEAVMARTDLVNPVHQNAYGEGFLAGLDYALGLASSKQRLKNLGVINEAKSTKVIRRKRS
jgi:hypothetical protein